MNTATRVGGFVLGLAGVFAAALAVGSAAGPPDEADATGSTAPAHDSAHGPESEAGHGGGGRDDAAAGSDLPGGLLVSKNGYTLDLVRTQERPGRNEQVAFVVNGPDGKAVTDYDLRHEKELHLIAVRRDFRGFQHVHPVRATDGTWTAPLDLTPGQWRVFADFEPAGGEALTLGADLSVAGDVEPVAERPVTRTSQVDGYTVSVSGDLTAGEHSMLRLNVSKNGRPVTDLQPYLGAYGHLVALRAGDLAYLHVHPDGAPGDGETEPGPDVEFGAEVPSPGTYHLYLDFKHDGVVRTATFTLDTSGRAAPPAPDPDATPAHPEEQHERGH